MMKIDPNISAEIEYLDGLVSKQQDVLHYLTDKLWDLVEPLVAKGDPEIDDQLAGLIKANGYVQFETFVRLAKRYGKRKGE